MKAPLTAEIRHPLFSASMEADGFDTSWGTAQTGKAGMRPCRSARRSWIFLLLATLYLLSFAAGSVFAEEQAPDRRIVRVCIPDSDMRTESGDDNKNVTFDKEYLQALAEYANWDCAYVPAPWSKCLEMVKSGEADILLDVSKTDERLQYYHYSSEPIGTEVCYLISRDDTPFFYNDFQKFNGMTVGYEQGSTLIDVLRHYASQKGFSFQEKGYPSSSEMNTALKTGAVDAVVQTNFLEIPSGNVIIAQFAPAPVYIVTNKKNTTLAMELDEAMAHLFGYHPNFNADLYRSIFRNNISKNESYTQQEIEYLKSNPVVTVLYERHWEPFEYIDSGDVENGITPDILHVIGKDTGITFRFVPLSSKQAVFYKAQNSSTDTIMAISYNHLWANRYDLFVTQPFAYGSVMMVTKTPDTTPKTVAVTAHSFLAHTICKEFPHLEALSYSTYEGCMNAVASGAADCTFLNSYQANYYRRSGSEFDQFSYKPVEALTENIALGVSKRSNAALLGILSKSLQRIEANELQRILSEKAIRSEPLSLRLLIRHYPVQTACALVVFSILLCLLCVLFLTAAARKRQNLALAEAKREADEANSTKSDFLSRMSHDIRTPLNGIIGMTYIASKQPNPEQTVECLGKIDQSSKFLLGLVNDILDMAKVESGKLELHVEPYYVDDFRNYINAVIQPLCDNKNQTLLFEVHPLGNTVPKMDILRTNQVYFNLLSNAVKYTPEGGTIRVTVKENLTPENKLRIAVSIKDSGVGMSQEFQKVLFNPFTQESRNDTSEMRGSGLGLAIVKKIIDALGGTIEVKSTLGQGTEFLFTADYDYLSAKNKGHKAQLTPRNAESSQSLEGKHILLCEDHPLNQEIVKTLLSQQGAIVETADDGALGVAAFKRSAIGYYDCILMDLRMPVMDGYMATRVIRALQRHDAQTVPIIALTADAFTDNVKKCLEIGMNAHIAKPINPETLLALLAAQCANNKTGR